MIESPVKRKALITTLLLAAILVFPFLMRKEEVRLVSPDSVVVVVTPHNESIRQEFRRGFRQWYREKTGQRVEVDWRNLGGTSEITRFVNSEYLNAFRLHWEKNLSRTWSIEVQQAFADPNITPDDTPEDDTPAQSARRAFLQSSVGCGIDVFFGGGSYDFIQLSNNGLLADSGIIERHPEWFGPNAIPQSFAGEPFWDPQGRWVGAVLSSFGIIYNKDALRRLGLSTPPAQWNDLTDPLLFGQVAAADPTKSGSMNKVFEMILQEQMQKILKDLESEKPALSPDERGNMAIRHGWDKGMRLVQKLSANARYFTDTSTKPNIDVSLGDCAVGMTIDFYGRFQAESTRNRGGGDRFGYLTPVGGSTVSVDPIGIFRGAPNNKLAIEFMDYVMSLDGQKLWDFKIGAPGGPKQFTLRRPPIRPELYTAEYRDYLSDPEVNPYQNTAGFVYHPAWTEHLFSELRFIIKVAFIDLHKELKKTWKTLIENDFPTPAMEIFQDLSLLSYDEAQTTIKEAVRSKNRIEEVQLAKNISRQLRQQYKEAALLARTGK